jgi:hypothetical protein
MPPRFYCLAILVFVFFSPELAAQRDTTQQRPRPDSVVKGLQWGDLRAKPNSGGRRRSSSLPNYVGRLNVGVQVGFPQGQFGEVAPDIRPWGVNVSGLFRLRQSPLYLGADLGFVGYGRSVELISYWGGGRIIRRNRMVVGNLALRLQPTVNFPISPYIEGLVGAKYFRTATEFESGASGNNGNRNSFNAANHQDIAFSYGGAGGLNIMLGQNVGIDLKAIYLLGGTATYVKPEDVIAGPDPAQTIIRTTTKSATDMIFGQIGVTFAF